MRQGRPRHPDRLTPAEWRVVNLVRHGLSNARIARLLAISRDGVKYHVANAVGKLALDGRAQLRHWRGAPADSPLNIGGRTMTQETGLSSIGQISRHVQDINRAVAWYRDILGLTHLFTAGQFGFFDCGGVRLFLSAADEGEHTGDSVLYFRTPDIDEAFGRLSERGVVFRGAPHMIHRHASGVEEWMAFFDDVDGKLLAIMSQVTR